MIRGVLKYLSVMLALLAASAVFPIAGFFMCRSSFAGPIFFFLAPFTCGLWCAFTAVRSLRAKPHTYLEASGRGVIWAVLGVIFSFGAEIAYAALIVPTPTEVHLLPLISYSPTALAVLWNARG